MRADGILLACALLAASASSAAAGPERPAEPLEAWAGAPVVTPPSDGEEPALLDLTEATSPLGARLTELAAQQRWVELAELLARVSDGRVLDGAAVRARGPGLPLLDPREDVRRRLQALPPPARDAYEAMVGPTADALLRDGRRRDGPLGELLARFGGTPAATRAARVLGERLVERGDLAGAALLWRRALASAPDPALELRLLALRTLLGPEVEGSLTPRGTARDGPWTVRWARRAAGGDRTLPRALAADGAHVYVTDHRGVLALAREDGRLVWRASLRGDPREQRLVRGPERLLLVRRDRLVALDPARGAVAWERGLELPPGARPDPQARDRFHDAVVTPAGFAVLATREGARTLVGVSSAGEPLFEQRLWPALPREEDVVYPYFARYRLAAKDSPDRAGERRTRDEVTVEPVHDDVLAPARRVRGDGRLAAVGDRILGTVDGVVFCAAAGHGGLLWVREQSFGLQVAGARTVIVQLAAGAFAVEAVTAAGQLVRLDPLDGSSLPLPGPPPGAYPPADPAAPPGRDVPAPFVLHLSPLVLGWEPPGGAGFFLTSGAPSRPVVRFAQGPVGPVALLDETVAFPDPEGVVLLDLARGAELGEPLPWTLAPGPVVARGGLLLAAGPDGLVVLGPDEPGGPREAPAPDDDLPLARWVDLLGHPDWRVRLRAQERLASLDTSSADATAQLERAAREAPTLDARDVARDLVEQARRWRLFLTLAPGARAVVRDIARGVDLVENLRLLRGLVTTRDRAPDELRRLVVEAEDPQVRQALLGLLLRVDRPARDRFAAALGDASLPDRLRAGCAVLLVEAAEAGGPVDALRAALAADPPPEVWFWVLAAIQSSVEPEALVTALPELERSFTRPPAARDVSREAALGAVLDAAPRLLP